MLKSHQFALASVALVSWTVVSLACGGKVLEGSGGPGGGGGGGGESDSSESYSVYSSEWSDSYTDTYWSSDSYGSTDWSSDESGSIWTESDSYWSGSDSYYSGSDSYYSESDSYYSESDTYYSESGSSSGEACVDFQLNPSDVVCSHDSDCGSVNTGLLCPYECLCGGTPANQFAVSALQAATASFPPLGCLCPSFGQPVCVSGRCALVANP